MSTSQKIIQQSARKYFNHINLEENVIASFGGSVNIEGLREEDIREMLAKTVTDLSEKFSQSGADISECIVDALCRALHKEIICAFEQVRQEQETSSEFAGIKTDISFGNLQNRIDELMQDLYARLQAQNIVTGNLEKSLENVISSLDGQYDRLARTIVADGEKTRALLEKINDRISLKTTENHLSHSVSESGIGDYPNVDTVYQRYTTITFKEGLELYKNKKYSSAINKLKVIASGSVLDVSQQEIAEAQYLVGECYYYGRGVMQSDLKQAVNWYTRAAENEHLKAQYMLGLCYYYGTGVKKSKKEARRLLNKSAQQGYEPASIALNDLE